MAYSNIAISAFTDIVPQIGAFAAAAGWTVTGASTGAGATRNLTRPGGGATILLEHVTGTVSLQTIRASLLVVSPTFYTQTSNVRVGGTTSVPTTPLPTNLHLFSGTEEGHAFIAAAIQFANGHWRHLYLGNMVKRGTYSGGEALSGTHPHNASTAGTFTQTDHKLLFGSRTDISTGQVPTNNHGGVHVDAAGIAAKWHLNRLPYVGGTNPGLSTAGRVFGGSNEAFNEIISYYGEMPFDAASILVPINLLITEGSPIRVRPIGHPAGVRLVSIKNYDPLAQITVAGETWRVFPMVKKSPSLTVTTITGAFNPDETSQYLGVAYPETF